MRTLFLDLETFSDVPITHGAHAYAERAEVLLVALARDDQPVEVWDTQDDPEWRVRLQAEIDRAEEIVIHNSPFDRTVLRWQGVNVPLERTHDTMARALAHSLPAALGTLCDVLRVPTDKAKDKDGKRLIQLFTKPLGKNRKLDRATRETHPEDWAKFRSYAGNDIEAMRVVYRRLPRWNWTDSEIDLWRLDQRINERGVAVDLELARAAQRAAKDASKRLAEDAAALTGGVVTNATQRGKTLDHLRDLGVETDDLRGGTVEKLLQRDDLTDDARTLLEIRAQASATSPAKYRALSNAASSDGRLRGTLQFCGAMRTGRWGGRLFQPQNLPRPVLKHEDIEAGIAAMKAGVEDLLFDNVMELCSSAVRGSLVAPSGRKLVIADLSNIEGRMLAFLANEEWKLKAFADFDKGIGHDLYKLAYARSFNRDPATVTKDERQIGKVMELALGYQGSVGAFASMAANLNVNLSEDVILQLVKAWRTAHGSIRNLWYSSEDAARWAITNPSKVYRAGLLSFRMDGSWLRMRLPSGRYLSYPSARLDEESKLSYEGVDQYTRKWTRLKTYGGKLCIARGTPVLTDAGWTPIEHITAAHRVWDGVEWVGHQGLADNGVKGVIKAHGVWMTPDHEVLTEDGWVRASQSEGHHRAPCRLPDGVAVQPQRRSEVAVGRAMRLREGHRVFGLRASKAGQARHSGFLRLSAQREYQREKNSARNVQAPGVCRLALDAGSLPTTHAPCVAKLRRARDFGLFAVAHLRGVLGGHGSYVPHRAVYRTSEQRRGLRARQLSLGHVEGAGQQPQTAQSVVFDIVNCGPRRRFVVADENGQPLIVHNCENATQAASRDILAHGMRAAEAAGYQIVLHVHDELICETPDTDDFSHEGLAKLMAAGPLWSFGLPLAAAGFETYRYRKD